MIRPSRLKLAAAIFISSLLAFGNGTFAATAQGTVTDAQILHLLNRITFGPTPGQIEQVRQMGLQGFIEQQLNPTSFSTPQLDAALGSYSTLNQPSSTLMRDFAPPKGQDKKALSEGQKAAAKEKGRTVVEELSKAKILRGALSPGQLQEVMTDFWFNHFNVYAKKNAVAFFTTSYERDAIRPHALGKFSDLLMATARHNAMMAYLDNHLNTQPGSRGVKGKLTGINENYARELMELHTLGVNGGYTQQDVTTLAHILTGWGGFDNKKQLASMDSFHFDDDRHDFSDQVLLGQTIKGGGEDAVANVILMLARHPSTAKYISYKLAEYFVSDTPPQSLVDKMAATFQKTDGDIRAVLSTLFYSSEFWDPSIYQKKFKSPVRYVISAIRASGTMPDDEALDRTIKALDQMGERPYFCVTPNGYDNTNLHWLSSDALMKRIEFATFLTKHGANDLTPSIQQSLGSVWSASTLAAAKAPKDTASAALLLSAPEFVYH